MDHLGLAILGERQRGRFGRVGSESEHYILEMERTFGWDVPPGKTEGLKFMRLNTDPINTVHRPLIWYIVSLALRPDIQFHSFT